MQALILIFIGGGIGSIFRYFLSKFINNLNLSDFPLGILGVNILACFLSGLLIGLFNAQRQGDYHYIRLFLIVGFCGGFSTFSGYSDQIIRIFFRENNYAYALTDILLSNVLCLAATFIGLMITVKEI